MTCGFFLGHLGLGDQILLAPAIKYLANTRGYNKLYVVVKTPNMSTIRGLLDVTTDVSGTIMNTENKKTVIEFLPIRATANLSDEISEILAIMKTIDSSCHPVRMHLSGHFNTELQDTSDFPICFYRQLDIDWATATMNYCVPFSSKSKLLAGLLEYIPYIFIHNISSTGDAGLAFDMSINSLRDRYFIVNPEKNMYPIGHVFYKLADKFLRIQNSLTLIDYKDVIENASELHMITSSYFCFAAGLLGVNASVKVAYSRNRDRFPTLAGDWAYIDI
jgi:hypothetical protein